jgi:hypothetical protein
MPTPGVPSTQTFGCPNPEAFDKVSKMGVDRALGGLIYNQPVNTPPIASSIVATSIFTNTAATAHGTLSLPANFFAWYPTFYADALQRPGCIIRGKCWGTVATENATTPNITISIGLRVAGTYRPVSSTGALAMVDTAAADIPFEWDFWMQSRTLGAATVASVIGGGRFSYFLTGAAQSIMAAPATIEITNIVSTVAMQIDSVILWGASHADNRFVMQGGYVEALG